jgi:hypothetical protein
MVNPNRFYTYAYLREDKTPYYIGKGSWGRIYDTKGRPCSKPKNKSRIILLKQNLTEEEAFKHEKYMISVFGRKDLGTGILRNKSDGGEGASGLLITKEIRITKSKAGKKARELGVGIHARTKEQIIEDGRRGGKIAYELGVGLYARTPQQISEDSRMGGKRAAKKQKELGIGIYGIAPEQRRQNGIKGGTKGAKNTNSQKWMCLETEYVTTAGPLTKYQRAKGIDTSKRVRIS